jgi:ribosomal protein S10
MILRRVIAHFRKQEWTAIFIDFVIVVVGVFVGLQVSNWNATRITRDTAKIVNARLLADVRAEALSYKYLVEYYREVREYAEKTVAAVDGTAPLPDEAFLIAAYRATQIHYYTRRRAVYDELLSTGEIGLVADKRLLDAAVLFYTTTVVDTTTEIGISADFRRIFRRAVPAPVQHALLVHCGDKAIKSDEALVSHETIDFPCDIGLTDDRIAAAAAALRGAPDLLPALQQRFADLETAVTDLVTGDPYRMEAVKEFAGAPQ